MQRLWGEPHRIGLWRRLWLALAEAERELGLAIPDDGARRRCGRTSTTPTSPSPAAYERRFRHDVMAHVHAFGDQAPGGAARSSTSAPPARSSPTTPICIVMRDGLRAAARPARRGRSRARRRSPRGTPTLPCLAYTHFQPAQLTTVGKRATLWMQDFALDVEELVPPARDAPLPRLQGHHRARRPRSSSCSTATTARCASSTAGSPPSWGSPAAFAVTGQTYPRKIDSAGARRAERRRAVGRQDGAAISGCCSTKGELLEPFESEQIGSSAMAYKRNPMRAERIARPRAVRDLAAGQRRPHRRHPVAGAHPGRQRQPPAHPARGVPRHRRDPGPRRRTSRPGSRCARR